MTFSHMMVLKKSDFTLTYFPLHPSLSECGMMCNFHTRKPSGIIKRHFCSGDRCVWNSKHHHASHALIFLQCTENVIDSERKTEELTARMLVHTLTFEKRHNTPPASAAIHHLIRGGGRRIQPQFQKKSLDTRS